MIWMHLALSRHVIPGEGGYLAEAINRWRERGAER
jgi:hypothetical protein